LLVIQMGGALIFPWGPWRQAVMSVVVLGGYVWLVQSAPGTFQPYSAGLLVTTAPLMVFAAFLIERYRSAAFPRDWQKDQIVSLARELCAEPDLKHMTATVLTHALRLLGTSTGSVVLRVPGQDRFRVEAVQPPGSPWTNYELSDDFGIAPSIGA